MSDWRDVLDALMVIIWLDWNRVVIVLLATGELGLVDDLILVIDVFGIQFRQVLPSSS